MTDARTDLDAIERAAKAATPLRETDDDYQIMHGRAHKDTDIIPVERGDVLALIAECRRLAAENAALLNRETDYMEFVSAMARKSDIVIPKMFQWRLDYLRAERGRLVNTTKHRDVTLRTYETPNESDGGE